MNDSAFIDGLRQRDPAAVQYLTDCYVPSIWRLVFVQVGGDHHLAEDIVSETVLALVRAAADGAEINCPGAWLRSVANHKLQDHFRAAARVRHLMEQITPAEPPTDPHDAPSLQQLAERQKQIRDVMDELPERHRMALEWKYIDKLAVREIAARFDLTEKAVESILFRARREFRDKLGAREKKENHAAISSPACERREATPPEPVRSIQPTTQQRS